MACDSSSVVECMALRCRGGVFLDGESEVNVIFGADAGFGNFVSKEGAIRSCQRFLPIAQTSSQEEPPMFMPCVLHNQAISHANNVIPSTKIV